MLTEKRVLAGDVGGTKTLLLLAEQHTGKLRILREARYENAAFDSLEAILVAFLQSEAAPQAACFAVAGPIEGCAAKLTNLPWQIDADRLAAQFGFRAASLINDFVAVGYGIEALGAEDCASLQAGQPQPGAPRAVLGAGTGLGECLLVWNGKHYEVIASEGGHVDFAPADALQAELLQALQAQYGHVSYERVLSGPGLQSIYAFLCRRQGTAPMLQTPAQIARADDTLAQQALDMFIRIYGAQAGNLALTCLARGGVYVAGGIAPQMLAILRDGRFMQAFLDKGRHSRLMAEMPVQVVLNPKVGLLGAAQAAVRLPV